MGTLSYSETALRIAKAFNDIGVEWMKTAQAAHAAADSVRGLSEAFHRKDM